MFSWSTCWKNCARGSVDSLTFTPTLASIPANAVQMRSSFT